MQSQELTRVAECLYRNGNGNYYAIVKASGKQIKRSLRTEDEKLAKRRLAEFRAKAERLTGDLKGLLFEELAKRWLELIKNNLKPSSYQRRCGIVKQVERFFKGRPVRSINQSDVEKWQIKRAEELSARSYNFEKETLRRIFDYAINDLRILLENPMQRVKRVKEPKAEIEIPSRQQFHKMIELLRLTPKCSDAVDLVEFLAYSGMRLGEAREVLWKDVNFSSKSLVVTGGELGTKNHEARTIPLFPNLSKFLMGLKERIPEGTEKMTIIKINSAKKALASACKNLEYPNFTHHSMRHFFCSNAIEAGIDFKVIAGWLGHKDGGILVAKTYGHLRSEHSFAMAQRMTFQA
ncbi:MAG: tyrosine-type recombinase/integrase [Verrucomicrobiota bacterium]|nr:tyrosine-type recombinase/integrase [Verrucomicrobiota bacterium]